VADLVGASDPLEIIFTSCGTEGNNAAIRSIIETHPEKRHIVTTRVEHPAVLGVFQYLEKRGYRVTWVGVDGKGMLDLEELRRALGDDTALVSVMYANNETGVIFPIQAIGEIVKARGIPFHVDAVQAAGKIPFEVKKLPLDLLTISGHKFHAPKGVGALYVRRGIQFAPYMIGGHQERNRRAGTENVAGIVAMGVAAEFARKHLGSYTGEVGPLRDRFEERLLETCPGSRINGQGVERLPNTSNVSFRYLEGEAILVLLDEHGICASTGSACTAGSAEPSHVLRAMSLQPDWLQGAVRLSFSRFNTEDEIEKLNQTLPLIVQRLQGLSRVGRSGHQPAPGITRSAGRR
jgi:cysteine desulfurase